MDNPFRMIDLPRIPGETVRRRVRERYLMALRSEFNPTRDFTAIPKIVDTLDNQESMLYNLAKDHLKDAANEDLPMEVRVHHFDIAGSLIYQSITQSENPTKGTRALTLWRSAGGL